MACTTKFIACRSPLILYISVGERYVTQVMQLTAILNQEQEIVSMGALSRNASAQNDVKIAVL
jgi:hypothetical protein